MTAVPPDGGSSIGPNQEDTGSVPSAPGRWLPPPPLPPPDEPPHHLPSGPEPDAPGWGTSVDDLLSTGTGPPWSVSGPLVDSNGGPHSEDRWSGGAADQAAADPDAPLADVAASATPSAGPGASAQSLWTGAAATSKSPKPDGVVFSSVSIPLPPRRRGIGMLAALFVMLAALVLLIISLVQFGRPVVNEYTNAPSMSFPGAATLHLGPGEYLVYARIESYDQSVGPAGVPSITPSQMSVTGPMGPVTLTVPFTTSTITRDGDVYASSVAFTLNTSGSYHIQIAAPGPGQALIGLSFDGLLNNVVGWLVLALLSVFAGIIGTAFFIMTLVRNRRGRRMVLPVSDYGYGPR